MCTEESVVHGSKTPMCSNFTPMHHNQLSIRLSIYTESSAIEEIPLCATLQVPMIEELRLEVLGVGIAWFSNLWSISSWSLLKGCGLGVVWSIPVMFARLSQTGFQFAGVRWIFQHVSKVWFCSWHFSHHGQIPAHIWILSSGGLWRTSGWSAWCKCRAFHCEAVNDGPSINLRRDSSWRTSEKTSRSLGKGLVTSIRPRTSSNWVMRPNINLKMRCFSTMPL